MARGPRLIVCSLVALCLAVLGAGAATAGARSPAHRHHRHHVHAGRRHRHAVWRCELARSRRVVWVRDRSRARHRHLHLVLCRRVVVREGTRIRLAGRHHPRRHHPASGRRPVTPGTGTTGTTGTAGAPTTGTTGTAPTVTGTFWVNPGSQAVREESSLRAQGDTADADALEAIASQPQATWFTDAGSGSTSNVAALTSAAAAAGRTPVFVVYDIPDRDCGGYSSGGAGSPSDYESFVDGVAAGLGQQRAVVIVEPDALSDMSCLPSSDLGLIRDATVQLSGDRNASVYVDAGNPGWKPASTEADELNQVLAGTDAGFAVNVSNFSPLATDVAYGTSISQLTSGRHFVVDTSRSGGSVAAGQWCNPSGARLGPDPTTDTGNPLVDAELWIKDPGESDGSCNGGPSAGQFWLSYALGLAGD